MRETGKKRRLTGVLAALCFTMALALALSSIGATLAKYIGADKSTGVAVAAPFYFTSDKLREEGAFYQVPDPGEGGTVKLVFTLSNFVDDLRCTETEDKSDPSKRAISYTWKAVSGSTQLAASSQPGELPADGTPQSNTVEITLDRAAFQSGSVTVTAEASAPYQKALSASFGFTLGGGELQWRVTEPEELVVLLELEGGSGQAVTVAWPSELSPDKSNDILWSAGQQDVTFTAQPGVRYALVFFKENPAASYSESSFTVTEG